MNIDFDIDAEGKQSGYIRLSHSTDESAYGWLLIPAVSIRNGVGPRILGLGGVHGDEFEGQIAWTRLAQSLQIADVRGHLLILPALNLPAALAGRRVSPLDDLNLNRRFPGDARGTPTDRIAALVERELLPRFDIVIDIHSGGNSLNYLPGPTITRDPDPATNERMLAVLGAFGAEIGYVFDESGGGDAALIGACRRAGVQRLGSEMGGGGGVSPECVRSTLAGILRVLVHLGAASKAAVGGLPPPARTRLFRRAGPLSDHYIYASEAGVFEPFVALGDALSDGQPVGQILFPETPWREPVEICASAAGLVICLRAKGRAERGDGLVVLGEELAASAAT